MIASATKAGEIGASHFCVVLYVVLCIAASRASEAGPNDKLVACQNRARDCGAALVGGEYEKVVQCTYPRVVEMVGGPQAMIKELQSGRAEVKKDGVDFQSVDTGKPKRLVAAGAELLGIVPTTLTMQVPSGRLLQKSYLLAVSPDDGRTWWFIDGAGLDADKVKQVIPKFPSTLKLPDKEPPRVVAGGR
jgi:hypothetical protein